MAATWRLGTASMVLATAWTMAGRVAEAQWVPLPLTVAIHNYAALPPPVIERAKGAATTIYGRIGVSLTWLEKWQVGAGLATNPAACPDSATPLIHLRLFGRSLHSRRPPERPWLCGFRWHAGLSAGRTRHIRGEEQEPGRRRSVGRHHGARDWPPAPPAGFARHGDHGAED